MNQFGVPSPPGQGAQAPMPPNWYPDPWGQAQLRYWNGSEWTSQTQTQPQARPDVRPKRRGSGVIAVLIALSIVAVLAVGIVALFKALDKNNSRSSVNGPTNTGKAPAAADPDVQPLGAPFTLKTCPHDDGCPVQIVLQQVECGLPPLTDPLSHVDASGKSTGTLKPTIGKFCGIKYQVANVGKTELPLIPVITKVVDGQGRTFGSSDEMSAGSSIKKHYGIETTMSLQPTQAVLDADLFDVPADATITKVVFRGGIGEDEVVVAAS